jgi:insulin-like growth factor 2 mRNA-binding protein 1
LQASYFIFEKVKDESAGAAAAAGTGGAGDSSDIKLLTMITVPRAVAGRIIGRQGKKVREIQRMTGATVKLNEDTTGQKEEVVAEVYGNFMATQV